MTTLIAFREQGRSETERTNRGNTNKQSQLIDVVIARSRVDVYLDDIKIPIFGYWSRFEFHHAKQPHSNNTFKARTIVEEVFHLLNTQPPHPSISKSHFII